MSAQQTYSNKDTTYDVRILWKIAPRAKRVPIRNLLRGMDHKIWGEDDPTPFELMRMEKGYHWDTAMKSDLRHPVIVTPTGWIADGNHRLVKALVTGKDTMMARWFDSFEDMEPARVSDIGV